MDFAQTNWNLCFIGYSAMDDFDILPTMRKNQTNKEIFWIKHKSEGDYQIQFNKQIEKESTLLDPNEKKYYRVKNVNDVLLTSKRPIKILISTDEFVKKLFPINESNKGNHFEPIPITMKNFESFAKKIRTIRKAFLLSNLFEKNGMAEQAIECLENTEGLEKNEEELSQVHYRLAGIYNRFYGKKQRDKVLLNYDKAIQTTKDSNRKAEFLISKANYYRREESKYVDAEKCMNAAEPLISDVSLRVSFLNVKGPFAPRQKGAQACREIHH